MRNHLETAVNEFLHFMTLKRKNYDLFGKNGLTSIGGVRKVKIAEETIAQQSEQV